MKSLLKYTLLLLCGCAVLMPAGCGTQPLDDIDTPQDVIDAKNPADTAPDTETLMAGIEPEVQITVETKTCYDSVKGKFIWSEGDQVALHYSDGNFHTCTIKADGTAGYKPVVLPSTTVGKNRQCWAVYPATAAVPDHCSFYELQVNYPDSYDISDIVNGNGSFEESCCPMVARNYIPTNYPTNVPLDFYHVGGLLRMKMSLLDARSAYVRFTFSTDVTGNYTVNNLLTNTPNVNTKGEASNNIVTVTLNGGNGLGHRSYDSPFYINVPVPCGQYSIRVEILDASSQVQESATIPVLIFNRHHGTHISFIKYHDRNLPSTYVPGKFSVSDTKSVYFAKGNLVVENTLTNGVNVREWKFEDAQYKSSGVIPPSSEVPHDGGYSKEGVTRGISHFGWATAGVKNGNNAYGYDPHHIYYEPHSLGVFATLYDDNRYGFGPSVSGDFWAGTLPKGRNEENNSWNKDDAVRRYCDWGVHFDDKGEGHDNIAQIEGGMGSWFTLSSCEWKYLLEDRNSSLFATGSVYDPASGEFVCGLIICPDNWGTPSNCIFNPGYENGYDTNKYTAELSSNANCPGGLWSAMEAAGAVFLPAVGYRYVGSSPEKWKSVAVGQEGSYWASSTHDQGGGNGHGASRLYFDYEWVGSQGFSNRYHGCSVRLVHD